MYGREGKEVKTITTIQIPSGLSRSTWGSLVGSGPQEIKCNNMLMPVQGSSCCYNAHVNVELERHVSASYRNLNLNHAA